MHLNLRILRGKWYWFLLASFGIALLGAGSAWLQDIGQSHRLGVDSSDASSDNLRTLPLEPDSFQSHAGFLTGANGPLESPGRKAVRLAEEARLTTRKLVKPDRSNVNCRQMRCIALTYDDGPEPGLTRQLLVILHERQAVATFFVLGSRVPAQPDTLRQIVRNRNEVGNHTWKHDNLKKLSDEQIADDIQRTNAVIAQATGRLPVFMRPPMGEYDARVAAATHMPLVLWTVDPRDWRNRDPEAVYRHVISEARQGRIILLHDTHPTTVQASRIIIDELQRQGYVLVTVSELLGANHQHAPGIAGQTFHRQ